MRTKYIKRSPINNDDVAFFEGKGFARQIAEMLSARGLTRENFDKRFGDTSAFHSPFEMANMSEAVETINYLLETGGSVLIYGDYDADGLTAAALLSLFFTDRGIENTVLIPTRDEGYGLHADKVIRAFKRNYYDLIITVDCGISNADEVNRIVEELGVEIIVTDHHELPDELPKCICVNPKIGYPFAYLSGSGVAWKLVEALAGRDAAADYSCLAMLGTIGDIMPMQDENRDIVKLGLQRYNHKNLIKLAEQSRCPAQLTCGDVAMKITPKINAAGRVGHPEAALSFLLCRDKADIKSCEALLALNDLRKQMLDEIIADSLNMCDNARFYSEKMVFLRSDKWNHGLLGIVAARNKEEYHLPALIMTKDGDNYVGSARGIENIDLFEAFCSCKDFLVKFGGHKASVGFSVAADKIDDFRLAIAKVFNSYDKSCFDKVFLYDVDLDDSVKCADIMSLSERLEPMLPQDKILCRVTDTVKFASSFGKDGAHLSATLANGLEVKGFFKYGKYAPFIKRGAKVDLICSLEIDGYTKNICGIIEDITLVNSVVFDDFYKLNLLKNFVTDDVDFIGFDLAKKILSKDNVLAVFDDYETYLKYSDALGLRDYSASIFFDGNTRGNAVIISPYDGFDYAKFDDVVYFCKNGIRRNLCENAQCVSVDPANDDLYKLNLTREICLQSFKSLKNKNKFDSIKSVFEKYLLGKMTYVQYVVSIRVFKELQLISVKDEYTVEFNQTEKKDLASSSIFRTFAI